jgi:dienelactone hydrolase
MRIVCLLSATFNLWAWAAAPSTDIRNIELADYKTHFRVPEYKSRQEWEEHKNHLRQQILSAAGLAPMPVKTPLHPRVIRTFEYEDYSIQVVLIESFPGYYLGGNLYLPAVRKGQAPAVLIPHGHWKRGRLENLPSYSVPALAVNLARQGYVAFAYDMVGFNDTRQTPHSFDSASYALWGFHPMGLQLWNSIRAVDYVQSLPEVDESRIAVTGASGGGSQTIFLTAVDDRIKVSAPVNMVSADMQGGDPCEEAPNLRLGTSNVEIAASAAPRPMLVVSSTHDWTRNTPVKEYPAIRKIYELYGRAQDVENVHIDAEHNYNSASRGAVYRFLAAHLLRALPSSEFIERDFQLPPEQDLLAFPRGDLPQGTANISDVFQNWKTAARLRTEDSESLSELRESLRQVFGVDLDPEVENYRKGDQIVLSRSGKHDRVTGYWYPGKGPPVLIVDADGARLARSSNLAKEVIGTGRPVLLIDPFEATRDRAALARSDPYFYSYNRSDDAERVQDILTALEFLHSATKGKPEVIGLGRAGVGALFAAAITPMEVSLIADLNGFSGSDQDFTEYFFVPGIQHAGGLNGALRLINTLRVVMPVEDR